MAGKLTLVAGPIGNLGDLTQRAKDALTTCDLVLAEDTRVASKLLSLTGSKPIRAIHEHSKDETIRSTLSQAEGQSVIYLSDAGCPCVSDPGASLVDIAYELGWDVDATPGPSAVTTALMLSGYYAQQFAFLGFLPKKQGDIARMLEPFLKSTFTLVVFESPYRVHKSLSYMAQSLTDRRYCVCRELTKLHQQVWRGCFPDVPTLDQIPAKGEFTLVIEGKRRKI